MEILKKEGNRKCLECKKNINLSKDKFVLLATCNMLNPKNKEEYVFFHADCWAKYFNDRVFNKASKQVKFMQDKALQVFNNPMIRSVLENVQGSEMLEKMLNTEIPIIDLNEVKKDGKRKTRKTKRR